MYLWKRFQFFDSKDIVESDGKTPLRILRELNPTCSCSGRGELVYGDDYGVIRTLDESFNVTHKFTAFKLHVIAMAQPKLTDTNLLVALGHDTAEIPVLKIYSLDGDEAKAKLLREVPVTCRGAPPPPSKASALAVLDDLTQVAVGTEQGTVFLLSGDIIRRPNFTLLNPKGPSVTGLYYLQDPSLVSSLFVVTKKSVDSYYTKNRNVKMSLEKEGGGEAGCAAIDPVGKQLTVGRDRAVYRYSQDGKGICYGFDNDKRMVSWFSDYMVLVCRDSKRSDSVTLYDLRNKLISFSVKTEPVAAVTAEYNKLFIITETGRGFALTERELNAKMQILQRKHLYNVAISLATHKGCSEAFVTQIYKLSADHKRDKGDYAGAMADYIRTIGHVEPSYVVRQFLDAKRICHLASYLEELHERNLANQDHTTLLLKCYTKLKEPKKLEAFIKTSKSAFDVDAAIRTCHKAGHYAQALALSKRYNSHAWYLRIAIEDVGQRKEAIEYISKLPPPLQTEIVLKYGHSLMQAHPQETTTLISNLCGRKTARDVRPPAEKFHQIFLGKPRRLLAFLRNCVEEVPGQSASVYNILLELYLSVHLYPKGEDVKTSRLSQLALIKDRNLSKEQIKERGENHQRAMQLLKSQQAVYDVNQALVAAKTLNFEKGMIYLYEKLRLYGEILQYYMDTENHKRLIRACINHGSSEPDLWVQALKYFAEREDPCEDEICQILDHIQDPKINLAPLMVLSILSSSESKKPFSVVKDYVIGILQRERDSILEDEKAIQKFQLETSKMRSEIEELSTKPITFMPSRDLMLPAVHFLCKHSYHEQVIGSRECPKCAPEYRSVMEIKEQVRQSASQHEQFFKMLEGSDDGFGVVAEYFGRGILEVGKGK